MESKGTVLLVDDSKALLGLISDILTAEGYHVISTFSGSEAIQIASELIPDLVLLDRNMPEMDGIEVCKKLKKDKKTVRIPIIFLTGTRSVEAIVEGFKMGAIDYITKPFQREELLARVDSHIKLFKLTEILKKQTVELKKSETSLKELNAQKDKLFSIIAHDLKGPLNNLIVLSEMIINTNNKGNLNQTTELSHLLFNTAKGTSKLLENLLEWAMLQRGVIVFNSQTLMLKKLVSDCFNLVKEETIRKKVVLINNVPNDQAVHADSYMFKTIIRNLITNAVKFTPRNGSITVCSESKSNTTLIAVSDTGVGIDPKTIKGLFAIKESKYTLGTEGETGTGLGLLLCKELVEKHGGKIWAESVVGSGSKFYIELPMGNE